jgi:hypothetical protein
VLTEADKSAFEAAAQQGELHALWVRECKMAVYIYRVTAEWGDSLAQAFNSSSIITVAADGCLSYTASTTTTDTVVCQNGSPPTLANGCTTVASRVRSGSQSSATTAATTPQSSSEGLGVSCEPVQQSLSLVELSPASPPADMTETAFLELVWVPVAVLQRGNRAAQQQQHSAGDSSPKSSTKSSGSSGINGCSSPADVAATSAADAALAAVAVKSGDAAAATAAGTAAAGGGGDATVTDAVESVVEQQPKLLALAPVLRNVVCDKSFLKAIAKHCWPAAQQQQQQQQLQTPAKAVEAASGEHAAVPAPVADAVMA